jgi:hypothetical protein
MSAQTRDSLSRDLMDGVGRGLFTATAFSVIALVILSLSGSARNEPQAVSPGHIVLFYYCAGVLGGIVFGLLRPMRTQYLGKLLTAYLILFLVYGGGTAAFLPFMNASSDRPVPLRSILFLWAGLCALLAPVYVNVFKQR